METEAEIGRMPGQGRTLLPGNLTSSEPSKVPTLDSLFGLSSLNGLHFLLLYF